MDFHAILLDVGGVLLLPERTLVSEGLNRAGVSHDPAAVDEAHYRAMGAADGIAGPYDEACYFSTYRSAYRRGLGIAAEDDDAAARALAEVFARPASESWRQVLPGAPAALTRLVGLGRPVAVVSNADGTIAESLSSLGICQPGAGPATAVQAIIDSGRFGTAKPDPRIFLHALEIVGVTPARTLFVGDSEQIDVRGSRAVGMVPIHVDPLALCGRREEHRHVESLSALCDLLEG